MLNNKHREVILEVIMTFKNLSFLISILVTYASISNAMHGMPKMSINIASTKTSKAPFKSIALPKIQSRSFFYGATAMHNPTIKKTVLLFSDFHAHIENKNQEDVELHAKELDRALKQQNDIISLVQKFEANGERVRVLTEDVSNPADIIQSAHTTRGSYFLYTPIVCLTQSCNEAGIDCSNLDFRNYDDRDYYMACAKAINNTDPAILKRLQSNRYTIEDYTGRAHHETAYFDATIFNTIKEDENSSLIFVCAGGGHTAAVSQILYTHGYNHVQVKVPQYQVIPFENMLYSFDKQRMPKLGIFTWATIKTLLLNRIEILPLKDFNEVVDAIKELKGE
jgi:rhodanese-related sulfurtransferase